MGAVGRLVSVEIGSMVVGEVVGRGAKKRLGTSIMNYKFW